MTKTIGAVVRNGRIEADAPAGWPDGTEVHICLVCRANLTLKDSPRTGAEIAVVLDLIAKEKDERASRASATTENT